MSLRVPASVAVAAVMLAAAAGPALLAAAERVPARPPVRASAEGRVATSPARDRFDRAPGWERRRDLDAPGGFDRHPTTLIEVETGSVFLGDVSEYGAAERPGSVVFRVVSARAWELHLEVLPLETGERPAGRAVSAPEARLPGHGGYQPLQPGERIPVAAGGPTSGAGTRVSLDLRWRPGDNDPVGEFSWRLVASVSEL